MWQLTVSAYDNCSAGSPTVDSRIGYATINIGVTDVNDKPPTFYSCCVNISIPESSKDLNIMA